MTKKKNSNITAVCLYEQPNPYKFKKTSTGRSPVSGWEEHYIVQGGDFYGSKSQEEVRMVRGTPSSFRGTHKDGKLRTSGKGHRLGKR